MAHRGELALEEAVDLSKDNLRIENNINFFWTKFYIFVVPCIVILG